MIVQVLAREIREHRGLEMAPPQPVHRKRVRTRLQHRVFPAGVANFGKKSLQIHGFGSGIRRGIVAPRGVIGDGAKQTGPGPGGLYDRIHQRSGGGLSVRSGHRQQLQGVGRMVKKIRGRTRQRFPRFSDLNPDNSPWKFLGGGFFARNGHSASFHRVLNKGVSVGLRAMQRKK